MTEGVDHHLCEGRFRGRRALITGGASGLGFACAERLAAEGAAVGLIDRQEDRVATASRKLSERGFEALGYVADVTDGQRIEEVVAEFGAGDPIDVLITAAGIFPRVEFDEMTMEQWRQVMEVNLGGTFACVQAVLPGMRAQSYGRIVTISSETFMVGVPEQTAYVASKAGVIGFTRSLARVGGPDGISANVVLPGLIETEGAQSLPVDTDALFEMVVAKQAVQRRGEPADIAEAVAFLSSEGAQFITGQSLAVGGGGNFL